MRRVEMIMTSPVVPALRRPRRALWLAFITDQREVGREMGTTARIVFYFTGTAECAVSAFYRTIRRAGRPFIMYFVTVVICPG